MTIFERYDNATKLWEFVAPAIPVPPKETLVWWLSKYTDEQFEKAVLKVPNRFRLRGNMSTDDAARMVTAELRDMNLRKGSRPKVFSSNPPVTLGRERVYEQ